VGIRDFGEPAPTVGLAIPKDAFSGENETALLREWANLDPLPKSCFILGVYCLKSRVFL